MAAPHFTTPPTLDDIAALADAALEAMPRRLSRHVAGVGIQVDEFAEERTIAELGLESPWDLTGLYQGTPLPLRSFDEPARLPDLIFLYRQPILAEWIDTGEDLSRLVASVLIHEIGHHFGFSDADIEALEAEI